MFFGEYFSLFFAKTLALRVPYVPSGDSEGTKVADGSS
jgi:hypothetical protein